jgi:CelD/BcsL family acetyltransferase involved in cellulose biosynthesis
MKPSRQQVAPTMTVREIVSLESLANTWNDVANLSHIDSVFLRYEWFDAAWQWNKMNSDLLILAIYEDGSLIGLCPLLKRNDTYRGMKIRRLEFLSSPDAQLCDIIAPEHNLESVINAIAHHLAHNYRKWDLFQINNIIAESPTIKLLTNALNNSGLSVKSESLSNNPSINLNTEWQTYYSRRSRSLKKGNNHLANRLKRAYEDIRLVWLHGNPLEQNTFKSTIDDLVHISSNSWKNDTGLTLDNAGPNAFIKCISEHANSNGWLSIWILYLNGDAVASEYQLIYKGKIHALRADYIQSFDTVSPGTYLNWKMLEKLFDTDLQRYEMGPGNNPYKYRWAEDETTLYQLVCYNKSLAGTILNFLQLKCKPFLQKLLRK